MVRSPSFTHSAALVESFRPFGRYALAASFLFLALCGCTTHNAPAVLPPADPMTDSGYRATLDQLRALNAQAQSHWRNGEKPLTAAVLKEAQPLAKELLDVRRPPREAFEAVSDFDQLYAAVLLANGHTVWARQIFMTDAARWRNWKPRTEDTERRLRAAERGAAEADRKMGLD